MKSIIARAIAFTLVAVTLTGCATIYTKTAGGMGQVYTGTECSLEAWGDQTKGQILYPDVLGHIKYLLYLPLHIINTVGSFVLDTALVPLDLMIDDPKDVECTEFSSSVD